MLGWTLGLIAPLVLGLIAFLLDWRSKTHGDRQLPPVKELCGHILDALNTAPDPDEKGLTFEALYGQAIQIHNENKEGSDFRTTRQSPRLKRNVDAAITMLSNPPSGGEPWLAESDGLYQITEFGRAEWADARYDNPYEWLNRRLRGKSDPGHSLGSRSQPGDTPRKPIPPLDAKATRRAVEEILCSASGPYDVEDVYGLFRQKQNKQRLHKKDKKMIANALRYLCRNGTVEEGGGEYTWIPPERRIAVPSSEDAADPGSKQPSTTAEPEKVEPSTDTKMSPTNQSGEAATSSRGGVRARRGRVVMNELIDAGLLVPGTKLVSASRRWPAEAIVLPNGALKMNGAEYDTPSAAGKAAKRGLNVSGWDFWYIDKRGGPKLADLREQLQDQSGSYQAATSSEEDATISENGDFQDTPSASADQASLPDLEPLARERGDSSGTSSAPQRGDATMRALIDTGLLESGAKLVSDVPKYPAEATVRADGGIDFNGNRYASPSAAGEAAAGGKKQSGWTFWRVGGHDGPRLSDLRGELQKRWPGGDQPGR